MTESQISREEFDKLRTFVLRFYTEIQEYIERQRGDMARQVGNCEDYLNLPLDKSLLTQRRKRVKALPPS